MKDKKKAVKAPAKKTAAKKPAKSAKSVRSSKLKTKPAKPGATKPKQKIKPEATKSTAKLQSSTVDSTTAWAQKRGLKQIVIWGPEETRDAIRTAAEKAGVKMSTWILEAIASRLSAKTNGTAAASSPKKSAKKLPKVKAAVKAANSAKKRAAAPTYIDDGSKGINVAKSEESLTSASVSAVDDEAAA